MHDSGSSTAAGPVVRPATADDIARFYDKPPGRSVRAWVAEFDGQVIGLGGLFYGPRSVCLFSEMTPELRRHKRFIVDAAVALVALGKRVNATVIADPRIDGSERFLTWLGLVPLMETEHGKVFGYERH